MSKIKFADRYFKKGLKTIATSGTVIWTSIRHVYIVPSRTLAVLKRGRIKFQLIKEGRKS